MKIQPTISQFELTDDPSKEHILFLAQSLNNALNDKWTLFLRPYLNSEKPDLVLLHENVGIIFFHIFEGKYDDYKVEWKVTNSERGSFKRKIISQKKNNKFHKVFYPYEILKSLTENLINIYVIMIRINYTSH